jgi:hypothetical protein
MSLRPLKLINEGAFGELTLSEQDYLAYKAGLHLSKMDTNDLSALSTNTQAQLVGSFEDTFYTSGTGPVAGQTISRTYNVTHSSNLGSSSHTTTFASIINLPSVVYVGDTIEITVVGAATSTGTGFAEIEYQLGVTGVDIGSVSTVATPAASNIEGFRTTWEDFSTKTLTGTYSTTFSFTVTDVGILNITVSATSTDPDNAITNSFDDEDLPSIRVEPEIKPNTSSRVYELYQNNFDVSAIDEQHPSIINPVYWDRTANPAGIKEMNDSELDTVIENLLRRIFAGDLPGQYRLASVAPSNEWSEFIPDIFFDTRGDGSQTNYSIWVKTSNNTIPTPVRVVAPVRLPGSNQFGGFRELKDSQLEYTFGEKMKRIIQTSGIGKYQLRSSEQGVPTDPGVWEARGNAVDTNLSYEEPIGYISVNSYGRDYISSYEGSYTTDYNQTYTPTYDGFYSLVNYAGTFLSNYNSVFESRYTGNYVVEYATDYQTEVVKFYNVESSTDYIGEYGSDYEGTFEGTYQSNYVSLYLSDYASEDSETYSENNYEGDFTSEFITNYVTDYSIDYEVTYITDDYLADYATEYSGVVFKPFEGSFEGDFTSVYDGNIPTTYDGNYIASFEGVYEGVYEGEYVVGTYEVYSVDVVNYVGDYIVETEVVYEADYIQSTFTSYDAIFVASYEGEVFSGVYSSDEYIGNNFIDFVVNYEGAFAGPLYQGNVFVNFGTDYAPDYVSTYEDNPEATFQGVGGYTSNANLYAGIGAQYINEASISYSGPRDYTGLTEGRYEGTYLGALVDTDTFSRDVSYEGDFSATYTGNYETGYIAVNPNVLQYYEGDPRATNSFEQISFTGPSGSYDGVIGIRVIDTYLGPRGDLSTYLKDYASDQTDYLGPGTLDYSGPITSYDNTTSFLEEPIGGQVYDVDNLGGATPIIYEGGNSYWQVVVETEESEGGDPVDTETYTIFWEGVEVYFGVGSSNSETVGGYTYIKGELISVNSGGNFTYFYNVIRREAENYEASSSEQGYQGLNQEFYSGDYVGSYGSYLRSIEQLTASGLETYEGPFSYDGVSFEGPGFETLYAAEFAGIYEGPEYLGDYGQSYSSEFIGDYAGDSFIGDYLQSYEVENVTAYATIADGASYTSGYSSSFLNSQFTSNYVGPVYDLSTPSTFVENYVVEVATQSYLGEFITTSSINYSTDYVSPYESDVVLPYTGNYAGDYLGIYEGGYQSGYETIYQTPYEGEYVGNYTTVYATDYETTYIGNYVSDYSDVEYVGEYESSYASSFINIYTSDYSENYDGVYSSDFASTFTAIFSESYTGDLIINTYEAQYEKSFLSVYINETTEQYTTAFETNYAQVNTGDTEFPGYDGEDSVVAYSTDYDGSYDSKYSNVFLDIDNPQYTDAQLLVPLGSDRLITADGLVFRLFRPNSAIGTYTGNAQLTSTPIALETYTLYARVA